MKKLAGLARQLINRRMKMSKHLVFLALIVVIVAIKVKINIKQR
jgi:hypothetical protein